MPIPIGKFQKFQKFHILLQFKYWAYDKDLLNF